MTNRDSDDSRPVGLAASVRRWLPVVIILTISVMVLVWHTRYFTWFPDDAFISLRYAKRLLQGHGLTWTDGERVEGYTNFLWVLLVAAIGAFDQDQLVGISKLLGVTGVSSVFGAFIYATPIERPLWHSLPPLFSSLAIAMALPVAAFAGAGLEHPLLIALLIWGIVLIYPLMEQERPRWRPLLLPGVLLGLCCTVRADAPLLVGGVLLALVLTRRDRTRLVLALRLASIPAVCLSTQLLFRRIYYESWVPNTYYAKVALTGERLQQGLEYVGGAAWPLLSLLIVTFGAIAFSLSDRQLRARMMLPLIPLGGWLAYLCFIGGDNMPLHRHLVPAAALMALIATLLLRHLVDRPGTGRWIGAATGPIMAAQIGAVALTNPSRHKTRNLWNLPGMPLGLMLKSSFDGQRPLLAVDAAGSLPFYSELPALDMLGLNDRYITHHRPPTFGRGKLAHELGDGAYVLSRKPDIVAFRDSLGQPSPIWLSGRQMIADVSFRELYQLVTFTTAPAKITALSHAKRYHAKLWIRREDGVIGIRRTADRITVPGFLISQRRGNTASLDEEGRLGVGVTQGELGELRSLTIPPGRWIVTLEVDGDAELHVQGGGSPKRLGPLQVQLTVPPEPQNTLHFNVRPTGHAAAFIRGLELQRQ